MDILPKLWIHRLMEKQQNHIIVYYQISVISLGLIQFESKQQMFANRVAKKYLMFFPDYLFIDHKWFTISFHNKVNVKTLMWSLILSNLCNNTMFIICIDRTLFVYLNC